MKKVIFKIIIGLLLIPALLILIFTAALFITPTLNNMKLDSFAKQLNSCPLPVGTELLDTRAVCGKLNGNGNGMDFFACILVKSDLTSEELVKYYSSRGFKAAKKDNHTVDLAVVPMESAQLKSEYLEHEEINFDQIDGLMNFSGYYSVIIYDGGYSGGLDLRGN